MSPIATARTAFIANLRSVQELVDFDRTVLDAAVRNIARLKDDLADRPAIALRVGNTLQMLQNIRTNDSMRPHYSSIYNQCVVLLVSHFSSALHKMFVAAAPRRLAVIPDKDAEREELKISLAELRDTDFDIKEAIGELLVAKRDISFQDMQSTTKAFKTYLGVDIVRDTHVENIILSQAARHVIVHQGGIMDYRFMRQVSAARHRTVTQLVVEGKPIAFTPTDVETIASSMRVFVERVEAQLTID